jgi:hypothetical protein
VKTSLSPEDINLKANDIAITPINLNYNHFEINIETEEEDSSYNVSWHHNSSFDINAHYLLSTTGLTNIIIEKQIVSYNSSLIILELSSSNISDLINSINITYPDFWLLKGDIIGFNITSNMNLGTGFYLLTLVKTNQTNDLICEFYIPNLVSNADFSSFNIFETINGTLSFSQQYSDSLVHIFWYGKNNGSATDTIIDGIISFTFPPWAINGSIKVVFLVFDSSNLGIRDELFTIARLPSKLSINDHFTIPQYASNVINATYENLFYDIEIENSTLVAFLNEEQIPVLKFENLFQIQLSVFYLVEGNYSLLVFAQSNSHASVQELVTIYVYESILTIDFAYEKINDSSDFLFTFYVLSDAFPVGFAPIIIEVNGDMQFSGITNINGIYSLEISLTINSQSNTITCSILKLYAIIASKSFEINFESLYTEINRTKEEVIIMENITLTYTVQYSSAHNQWFTDITEDMKPILDAFIQTETSFIPVYWDNDILYWGAQADTTDTNHILKIITPGPDVQTSVQEEEKRIYIHFIIGSETKSYSKVSLIYYMNESHSSTKYNWQLFNNMKQDVTDKYDLLMNDLYAYVKNINVSRGNFLILDLIGTPVSNLRNLTSLVIPLVSGSGVVLGAITTIVKIYNKRKGMILEV